MRKAYTSILFLFLACSYGYAQDDQQTQRLAYKQKLTSSVTEDSARVDLLSNLAFSYAFEKQDSAIYYGQQGLEISKRIVYKTGEANCLNHLSTAMTISGNYSDALHYGFECLSVSEEIGDSFLIVGAFDNLMGSYREQEDYKEALKYGYKGLPYLGSSKVPLYLKALLLGGISSVYEKNNQLDSALFYGLKAFEIAKWWSGLYLTLGNIYGKSGEINKSFLYYRSGIQLAEQNSIFIDLVDIFHKMSLLFESAGNLDSSFHYAKKAIYNGGAGSYPEGELRAAVQLAHLCELQGVKDSTIKYLKLSSAIRNSLISRQKTREAQSFAFNEQWRQQELITQMQQNRSKIRMYVLIGIIFLSLIVAYFFWRNNRHKQKSNIILQEKNTEIQAALTTLKATQSQLIQSEKMASLGELTAGIAHEIQNPLNFVNNFSELSNELIIEMNEEIDKGNTNEAKAIASDIKQNLEKITHHGKRADSIVKGMLQHSQKGSGQKELTDINAMAEEYLRLAYHGCLAKDITLNASFVTELDMSIGNVNLVQQDISRVLLNLYNNAFYAVSAKAKELSITMNDQIATADAVSERQKMEAGDYQPTVTLTTKKKDKFIEISVRDNGSGIPESIKDKIFQPFFTTKPTGQGTGLGLSLSYDIIKAHQGKIDIRNTPGEGAEFIITLPVNA